MERDFVDSKSQIQLKVGLELTWIWGYKVFELKNSEGLDRFSYERRTLTVLDSALSIVSQTAMLIIASSLLYF